MRSHRTRRRALVAGLLIAAAAAQPAPGASRAPSSARQAPAASPVERFVTRPDLRPPAVQVLTNADPAGAGDFLLTPKRGVSQPGTMIVDGAGRTVWFRPSPRGRVAFDLRVQTYRSRPVLTWWEGRFLGSYGEGEGLVYDSSYRPVARVRAGNGLRADMHDFVLTSRGTALLVIYRRVPADLSRLGGPRRGTVLEAAVQEVDVATGAVRFEWHSLRHVALRESYMRPTRSPRDPFDYFHINSVELDRDGNLLISGRHTHTVYKLDRRTGRVLWRLGGKRSDFRMGRGTHFSWQHDARRLPDGTITVFDNRARLPAAGNPQSRALVIRVDEAARTATLVRAFHHPARLQAASQANAQAQPDGGVVIGWGGRNPFFSQFDAAGALLFDARFLDARAESYRAYRLPWSGRPLSRPRVAARASAGGTVLYASWNGAGDVAAWRVLAGPSRRSLTAVADAPRTGLETAIPIAAGVRAVAVFALGADGRILARSRTVATAAA